MKYSRKRKQNGLLPEQTLYEALTESAKLKTAGQGKDDEDQHFLLSLVSEQRNVPAQYKLDIKTEILNVLKTFKRNTSPHIAAMQSHFPVHENIMYNQQNPSSPSSSSALYSNQTPVPPRFSIPSPAASLATDSDNSYLDLFPGS
jgi:hypothetical protein